MNQTIPKYMTIGQFSRYANISRWHLRSMIDRFRIPLVKDGTSKMLDVELALACMEKMPQLAYEQEMIPDPRFELIERLKAAIAAETGPTNAEVEHEPEPQNAA